MPLSIQARRAWLEKVPLLSGCPEDVIANLAEVTAEISFADGQAIVRQGQVGNGLYILVSGSARIVQGSDELTRIGPGDFFGELAVIDQRPRTASAIAVGATVCLALASWDLLAVLEREPSVSLNLLRELARRLRATDEQLRH